MARLAYFTFQAKSSQSSSSCLGLHLLRRYTFLLSLIRLTGEKLQVTLRSESSFFLVFLASFALGTLRLLIPHLSRQYTRLSFLACF